MCKLFSLRLLLALAVTACPALLVAADASQRPIDFNRDIRPILSNNCYTCHGPDDNKRQAGLRLDRREAALAPLDSGNTAVVPGDPDHSELWARVSATDADMRMPPPDAPKQLSWDPLESTCRHASLSIL